MYELSALVFDLPDEVLAACGEGWTEVHGLLVLRMEVITTGPYDCSLCQMPICCAKNGAGARLWVIPWSRHCRSSHCSEHSPMWNPPWLALLPNSHEPWQLRPLLAQR